MSKNEMHRLEVSEILGDGHILVRRRTAVSYPIHCHSYFELEIVMRGRGTQLLNGGEYPLSAGTLTFLTPADIHRMEIVEDTEIWNISFDSTLPGGELLTRMTATGGFTVSLSPEMLARLDRAANFLLAECGESDPKLSPLITYIMELVLPPSAEDAVQTPIARALLYIDTYFRESPNIERVAAEACLSPVYFGTLFKRVTGQSYLSYLNARKVECAAMLLANGMSVSGACFESGFGSLSGFLYTFKRHTGQTPEDYSRQNRKDTKIKS